MVGNSLALALLSVGGFYFLYSKLPRKVRKLLQRYSLLTDAGTLIGIYLLFGSTLTALLAGAIAGIMVSVMLYVANNKCDYLVLWDIKNFLHEKLQEIKKIAEEYGATYRAARVARNSTTILPETT